MSLSLGVLAGHLVTMSGCGAGALEDELALPPDAALPPVVDAAPPDAPPPLAATPFAADVRSLRLKRSIAVRAAPAEHAPRLGTVARDIHVGWKRVQEGEGCAERWIEIEPYGWVCERYVEPSRKPPHGVEIPQLQRGEIVPGAYGKLVTESARTFVLKGAELVEHRTLTGSVMVRRYGEHTAAVDDGEVPGAAPRPAPLWLIDRQSREYLPGKKVRELAPSGFHGTRLGDETGLGLPVGFPLSRQRASTPIQVYSAAQGGRVKGKIPGRVPVAVLEIATNAAGAATAYRIGEGQWVRADDMRLAAWSEPPHLTEPAERWIDIDLDEQVLVAYEGDLPVYATLVATGARKTPTETGVYRIWVKFAETDMKDLAGESPYSVATVPWTQFYAKDLALHTAYWHDRFGTPRSHGCTNLAPRDARFLYFWSEPQVPPGWSMANGSVDLPGSVVRVRSKQDPEPEMRGYARRVYEARLARRGEQAAVNR